MKQNLEHVMHAVIISVVLYFGMVHLLNQSKEKACSRSILFAGIALVYMIMFGHSFPPGRLNPSLGF
tara:strand:+ start:210 stop:410 length:201 start_codon:yes stop_codon:yes gene_type:complete